MNMSCDWLNIQFLICSYLQGKVNEGCKCSVIFNLFNWKNSKCRVSLKRCEDIQFTKQKQKTKDRQITTWYRKDLSTQTHRFLADNLESFITLPMWRQISSFNCRCERAILPIWLVKDWAPIHCHYQEAHVANWPSILILQSVAQIP